MYKRKSNGWKKHLDFMLIDTVFILITFIAAFYLYNHNLNIGLDGRYRSALVRLCFCSAFVGVMHESYEGILRRGYWLEAKETAIHVSLTYAFFLILIFLEKDAGKMSRLIVIISYLWGIVFCYIERLIWKRYVIARLRRTNVERMVFLVTNSKTAEATVKRLKVEGYDISVAGMTLLDRDARGEEIEGLPVVCNVNEMIDYLIGNVIDEVFFCTDAKTVIPDGLIRDCQEMGITTHVNLLLSQTSGQSARIERFCGYNVITSNLKTASPRQLFVKRSMDIVGGLIGCIVTGLLCIYVVPKIKKADPGPAFFTQTRIGKHGREFKIYKFRSMYMDAEARKAELMAKNEMDGFMFKMEKDPRILPGIGEFIRRTSIDEFPQFFNVLKGEMSLCGTRPPLPGEVDRYELQHYKRLAVKPGITGLWQTSGRSNITDFDEVVRLDARYIKEWNIGMDIRIILKTLIQIFKKDGAK